MFIEDGITGVTLLAQSTFDEAGVVEAHGSHQTFFLAVSTRWQRSSRKMQYAAKISKILKTASSSQLVEFMTRKEPEIQTERSCYTLSARRMPFHLTLSTCQAPTDNQRTYKVAAFGVAPLKPLRRTACPGHAAHGRVRERTLRATNSFMQTCLLLGGPFHSYR